MFFTPQAFLMSQPLAYQTPDVNRQGFIDLPEFPFALEPRICTRWEMHKYARDAYALGVRYIGGCCGFEPYHVRALAEELATERGKYVEQFYFILFFIHNLQLHNYNTNDYNVNNVRSC